MKLLDYEEEILQEIEGWEKGDGGTSLFNRATGAISKPMDWLFANKVSQSFLENISESVYSSLNTVYSASGRTFNKDRIIKRLEEEDIKVPTLTDVKYCDIRRLDRVAREHFGSNALYAALEGGGCGLGGAFVMAADIPLLMGICFRVIQQMACTYGYDPTDELEIDVALKVLQIAGSPPEERRKGILELDAAFSTVRTAGQKVGLFAGLMAVRHLSTTIGTHLARRKLGQLIPLVGLGIGAGINYQFTWEVGQAAYMLYRKRFLLDKMEREEAAS